MEEQYLEFKETLYTFDTEWKVADWYNVSEVPPHFPYKLLKSPVNV